MNARRYLFYVIVLLLVILNSLLLSSPNLLGKVGLIIYKYSYLRTFPRTLLTVSLVCGGAVVISWVLIILTERKLMMKRISVGILLMLIILCVMIVGKVMMNFTAWTYAHTGLRFRLGAYSLPLVLILIFANAIWRITRFKSLQETQQTNEEILGDQGDQEENVNQSGRS